VDVDRGRVRPNWLRVYFAGGPEIRERVKPAFFRCLRGVNNTLALVCLVALAYQGKNLFLLKKLHMKIVMDS
jgi:hypothetical protein